MSKSPINEAILLQVLSLMRNGQLQRCAEMGLDAEVLGQLQHPTVMSLLTNTPVAWAKVTIDKKILLRLLKSAVRTEEESRLLDRAIRLGATTSLLNRLFGLTPQNIAMRRAVIGVKPPHGRWPELSEDQDAQIWHRWTHLMSEYQVDVEDNMAMLDVVMIVTEELAGDGLTLAQIWSRVTNWIKDGLYPTGRSRASVPITSSGDTPQQQLALATREGDPTP